MAIEVKYHASCHRDYTRILSKPLPTGESNAPYGKSFAHFAKYAIEGRLIKNKEILRLTKLKKLFVKAVSDVEQKDASGYKTWSLKQRIKRQYPQVCFVKPKRQYESEFVFADTLTAQDLVEESQQSDGDTTDTDTSSETDTDTPTGDDTEMRPT